MRFICNGCDKEQTNFARGVISAKGAEYMRFCSSCIKPRVGVPDVYWDGKPEENLADDPATGKPRVFASPGEKASYLKSRGIMEAGDRVHGAPPETWKNGTQRTNSRHEVQMALKKVREMGRDNRRQEFLKITKENQRQIQH